MGYGRSEGGTRKTLLEAKFDTSTSDEIHAAAYKSYHTTTPNGYNLQMSYVTHEQRLTLANAVKPKVWVAVLPSACW
jgi:hypothetical protein